MARGHKDLPRNVRPIILDKQGIFADLKQIDNDKAACDRILRMENDFRTKITNHLGTLPTVNADFVRFNTSPFVLMFYSKQKKYAHVREIEKDIIPAKVFSSMETSAGRMVEMVVLPAYGWRCVESSMHSTESVIDGEKIAEDIKRYEAVTLKSGPRCLNDEMAKDIGTDIATKIKSWAEGRGFSEISFTYGVLYGTKKISNKKDWHVIRNISENLPAGAVVESSHSGRWGIDYKFDNITVSANVRIGLEWWDYLGGRTAYLEVCAALIRACIEPAAEATTPGSYTIRDLGSIVSVSSLPNDYNVKILQKSQYEWLLFLVRHFCDGFTDRHNSGVLSCTA